MFQNKAVRARDYVVGLREDMIKFRGFLELQLVSSVAEKLLSDVFISSEARVRFSS